MEWLPAIFGDEIVVFSYRKTSLRRLLNKGGEYRSNSRWCPSGVRASNRSQRISKKTLRAETRTIFTKPVQLVFRHVLCIATLVYQRFDECTWVFCRIYAGFSLFINEVSVLKHTERARNVRKPGTPVYPKKPIIFHRSVWKFRTIFEIIHFVSSVKIIVRAPNR